MATRGTSCCLVFNEDLGFSVEAESEHAEDKRKGGGDWELAVGCNVTGYRQTLVLGWLLLALLADSGLFRGFKLWICVVILGNYRFHEHQFVHRPIFVRSISGMVVWWLPNLAVGHIHLPLLLITPRSPRRCQELFLTQINSTVHSSESVFWKAVFCRCASVCVGC